MQETPFDTARIRPVLHDTMALFPHLKPEEQAIICDFVTHFYLGKNVYLHPEIDFREELLITTAANAALVGAAQNTRYFTSVKWLYFCLDDLEPDGDARLWTTVRLDADLCMEESAFVIPGQNLVVHEFSHVLDALFAISGSTPALREASQRYQRDMETGIEGPIVDCHGPAIESPFEMFSDDFDSHSDLEFFAGASEAFFTDAAALKAAYPDLFQNLVKIYGLDLSALNWGELQAPGREAMEGQN